MRLKLEISPQMADKFQAELAKQMNEEVWEVNIKEDDHQYQFAFRMYGSDWHVELDKECNAGAWYTLHCSTQELHLPIHYIKDIRIFCQQISRIRQMQSDYIDNKNK
jgi:hypothetical protein